MELHDMDKAMILWFLYLPFLVLYSKYGPKILFFQTTMLIWGFFTIFYTYIAVTTYDPKDDPLNDNYQIDNGHKKL